MQQIPSGVTNPLSIVKKVPWLAAQTLLPKTYKNLFTSAVRAFGKLSTAVISDRYTSDMMLAQCDSKNIHFKHEQTPYQLLTWSGRGLDVKGRIDHLIVLHCSPSTLHSNEPVAPSKQQTPPTSLNQRFRLIWFKQWCCHLSVCKAI